MIIIQEDGGLSRFLETGLGQCPLGSDEDQLGYECGEKHRCRIAQQAGECPYEFQAAHRTECWAEAVRKIRERRSQDPWNLRLPLMGFYSEDDDPWTTG